MSDNNKPQAPILLIPAELLNAKKLANGKEATVRFIEEKIAQAKNGIDEEVKITTPKINILAYSKGVEYASDYLSYYHEEGALYNATNVDKIVIINSAKFSTGKEYLGSEATTKVILEKYNGQMQVIIGSAERGGEETQIWYDNLDTLKTTLNLENQEEKIIVTEYDGGHSDYSTILYGEDGSPFNIWEYLG
jgi:hypothetical protein